ncbi:hypothetical protein BKK80_13570 [Cupriavidus malaysiensis]|uniref:DNA-binding protein n=1 Tax=Cupriavidus malaysiensis TaxID=367825 RepID=A0ABN4TKC1_9BURK|nr:hypothetical protein BKK80_13570 [Cupriavidus malaysiensis]
MKVTPTCRYEHGELQEIPREPETHYFGLMGATLVPFRAGTPVGEPLSRTTVSGRIYTVSIFRCPVCGYLEMFDDEVGNG